MKLVRSLIYICIIIGLVVHVQEIGAHKEATFEDEGEVQAGDFGNGGS